MFLTCLKAAVVSSFVTVLEGRTVLHLALLVVEDQRSSTPDLELDLLQQLRLVMMQLCAALFCKNYILIYSSAGDLAAEIAVMLASWLVCNWLNTK